MKKIELNNCSDYIKNICTIFTNECIKTNLDEYNRRNQNSESKIKKDIYLGKIAEFLVYEYLISKNKKLSPPDLFIYDFKKKSFDSDLTIFDEDQNKIHVKSHDLSSNFPISWVFQENDPLVIKPTENDFMALCCISKEINYMYLVKALDVKELYKDPVKENLKKSVLYEEDLIQTKK